MLAPQKRPTATGGILLACLLLAAPSLRASDLVVYGPEAPSTEGAATAVAVFQAVTTANDEPEAGVVHLLDLPFPSREPIWMAGNLLQLPCADPGLVTVNPAETLSTGTDLVDQLDYERALLTLDQGIRALPCTSHEVPRQVLIDLHFFQGLAHFELGNRAKARRAFLAALAIHIDTPWNSDYPPAPQQLWESAKSELAPRTAVVGIDVSGEGLQAVFIDGMELSPATPTEIILHHGRHLVRYVDKNGVARASLVDVSADGGALVTAEALRAAVLNLAWSGVSATAARLALRDLASRRNAKVIWVVSVAEPLRAYRFQPFSRSVAEVELDPDAVQRRLRGAARRSRATPAPRPLSGAAGDGPGRLGIQVTAGLLQNGEHTMGDVAGRLHLRLVGGLELGLGFESGLVQVEDDFLWLPLASLDLRGRLERGPVHFFAGGRGLVGAGHPESAAEEDDVSVLGGGAGLVGIDITPAGNRGFFVTVEAAAGVLTRADGQGPRLHLSLGAGIGARL